MIKVLTALILIFPSLVFALGGDQICELGASTSSVTLCETGPATFEGIDFVFGIKTGDFCSCYDSASVSGFVFGSNQDGSLLNPKVADVRSGTVGNSGMPNHLQPTALSHGLVCNKSAIQDVCLVHWQP